MDPLTKIHVLNALENGRSKADVARDYGVHPRTIAYIYQQKDSIIKKYAQKYKAVKEVHCINLEQTLLNWLKVQIKNRYVISESELYKRAQEIISTQSNEDLDCIDEWVQNFKKRHNIMKYVSRIKCSPDIKKEWMHFCEGVDVKDVYIGEMCGLFHSHTFEDFVNRKKPNERVSTLLMVNCLGTDKLPLVVAGEDEVKQESIRSLPVNYFHAEKSVINYNIIKAVLNNWDRILQQKNRSIYFLVSDDVINQMQFENIKMVNSTNMVFLTKCKENIAEALKYNYRRLLITKKLLNVPNQISVHFVDYLHLISAAWQSISSSYIRMLFFPPADGSLYFEFNDYINVNHSLSDWCGMQTSQFGYNCIEDLLDNYTSCDKDLYFLNRDKGNNRVENINAVLLKNDTIDPGTSIPAFQAIKRLVSYLQSENVGDNIMNAALKLENHLEYDALSQVHNMYAKIKNNDTD